MVKKLTNPAHQRLVDFFWVYFDAKLSRKVDKYPEIAIPILKEKILEGLPSLQRLNAYAAALRDASELQSLPTRN